MSKLIPGNQKHMTLSCRIEIEKRLKESMPLKEIAKILCKDPTTISKEIKLHRQFREKTSIDPNTCKYKRACKVTNLCRNRGKCYRKCSACRMYKCNRICPDFAPDVCATLIRAPYVCNGCAKSGCRLDKYYYRAEYAQKEYEALRREARIGVNATPDDIAKMDKIISAGVKKKQSIAHIVASNRSVITCTEKTIYNYIAGGYFSVHNLDLPRKLHFKPRKTQKAKEEQRLRALEGRRYQDFTAYISKHGFPVVEMDTVHAREGTKKVLLTMQLTSSYTLLSFLLESCIQEEVVRVFDEIELAVTPDVFKKTFPVFLTDRGPEFLCPDTLERSIAGGIRTKVFYCDPNAPFQKGCLEQSHSLIRRYFPKLSAYSTGKHNTFENMSQEKISLMTNHINSHVRDSIGGLPPMFLATAMLDPKVIEALGLALIPHDEVTLSPALLK
jgi:IS30 family transposase